LDAIIAQLNNRAGALENAVQTLNEQKSNAHNALTILTRIKHAQEEYDAKLGSLSEQLSNANSSRVVGSSSPRVENCHSCRMLINQSIFFVMINY